MELFSVIGHDVPKRLLAAQIKSGNLSHFYLFIGPPGVGKGIMAKEFAIALNCDRGDDLCGKKIQDNIHPDVKIIKEEKNIKISQIKDIEEEVNLSLLEGSKKVVIIEDAERLTLEAANALLKTLEEPPENTVFILTRSYPSLLLKTVVSRAQVVKFSLLSYQDVEAIWLRRLRRRTPLPIYDGTLHFVKTLSLRSELFKLFSFIIYDEDKIKIDELFEYGNRKRNVLRELRYDIINIWSSFLHDVYHDVYIEKENGIINLYKKEEIKGFKRDITDITINIYRLLETLSFLERGMIYNLSFNTWWEYLMLSTYDILFGG